MKYKKIKIHFLKIFSSIFFVAALLRVEARAATESEFSQVFAEFITTLYANTQTLTKAGSMCFYGSDDISIRVIAVFKNAIIIEEGDKKVYKECRIVYVAKNKERSVKSFIANLNQSGALTIATFDSFVDNGGMMLVGLGRRDFELTINPQAFKTSGVRLDSSVMTLIINSRNH